MSEKNRYSDEELVEFKLLQPLKFWKKGQLLCRKKKQANWHSVSKSLFSTFRQLWCVSRIKLTAFVVKPVS